MKKSILSVENVTKYYDDNPVLKDISIHLDEGELVCLLGISGRGKTTLFNIISGLILPSSGKVFLEGNEITGKTGKVSYMLQKDMLLPWYNIIENVALPLIIRGMKKKDALEKADVLFSDFSLDGTQKKYPFELSGGMKQRAALLRTYLFSSKLALLDEPFSALDAITKMQMHKWFLDVMEKIKLSTLFITHDIDEAILLSDRIYILSGESGQPGMITKEIVIKNAKPRSSDFSLSSDFIEIKKQILESLQN